MDISINQINSNELEGFLNENTVLLVDVRTEQEHKEHNIGGINIPFKQIPRKLELFITPKKILIYCNKGEESFFAVQFLQLTYGIKNVYNLRGGISSLKAF